MIGQPNKQTEIPPLYIYRLSTDYKDQMIFSVKGAEFQVTLHAEILMLDCKHKRKS